MGSCRAWRPYDSPDVLALKGDLMRSHLIGVIEVASAACITVGAAVVLPAAGWITAGVLGLVFAWRATK
mgnify:FL=1